MTGGGVGGGRSTHERRNEAGPAHLAAIALTAWASILGYLVAEIFGSLPQLITDPGRLWDAHLRTVMLGMGFTPALTGSQQDQPAGT